MGNILTKEEQVSMNGNGFYSLVRGVLPPVFECSTAPHGAVRVFTPFLYPDGGVLDIFVLKQDEQIIVTDYGDALGWIRVLFSDPSSIALLERDAQDICRTLQLEYYKGEFIRRIDEIEALEEAILDIAQAVIRITLIWCPETTQGDDSIQVQVFDWLRNKNLEFVQAAKQNGQSGRTWTIDYQTEIEDCTSLIFLLSSKRRRTAKAVADHVAAGCADLHELKVNGHKTQLISLFDDKDGIWDVEDYNLLKKQSIVVRWSQPDDLERTLRGMPGK